MGDLGCGARCAKLIILLINTIFLLIGIFLLGIGTFLVIDTKYLHNQYFLPLGGSAEQMIVAAGVILIVGVSIVFVTIVGCCGTLRHHTGCLTFYSAILIILLVLQIAAVIIAGVFYDKIIDGLGEELSRMVQFDYGMPDHNDTTKTIDLMQKDFTCCGVTEQGPLDWRNSSYSKQTPYTVPESCCTEIEGKYVDVAMCRLTAYHPGIKDRSKYIYIEGCDAKLDRQIKHYVGILIGVVIGVVVIQVVFIVITCLLKSSITRGYEYV